MRCITCNIDHENTFCPQCGEKGDVPKITFTSMFTAGLSTVTNMDKGFLYDFKQLFINPKTLIEGYIGGKRKNILNPISYLIISVTIYLIVDSMIHVEFGGKKLKSEHFSMGYELGKFLTAYFKYFWISNILWLSLATRLVFRKYSLAEHLAINAFVLGQTTLVSILMALIFKWKVLLFNPLVYIMIVWLTYKVHKRKSKDVDIFLMSIAALMIFLFVLVAVLVCVGYVNYYVF